MFVTKDEIRQIANDIIVDDFNNDILFIIANKGFRKYKLLQEIYGGSYQSDVIIVNGEAFHADSIVKNCLLHGIFEYLRRHNTNDKRRRLYKIVSNCGKRIPILDKLTFYVHVKINRKEIETLLESLSLLTLIDVYDKFSNNTPLVLFIKGAEINADDESYLKHSEVRCEDARLTYIIALRPDTVGLDLIKSVCQVRNERIWICPLLPTIKEQIINQNIVDIPEISLTDIQDSTSYHDFKRFVQLKDYYIPVFELVSELLSMNISPSMIFTVANQEIGLEDFQYINDVTKRLLHVPSALPSSGALVTHNGKYIWVDALAYYILVNEGAEKLLLEMQKFYFSFLVKISRWKDKLEEYGDMAETVEREKMNNFLKRMSKAPDNPIIPGIADYTSRFSDWIRSFSRPMVTKKVHYSSMERLVNELFSFCVGFSDVNIEALHIISTETGRLGSLDIALSITAKKLLTKPKLSQSEQLAIDKLIKKSLEELIRWNDMLLVEEVCKVLVLLNQIGELRKYYIPEITNNHSIYHYLKDTLKRNNINEGDLFMGRKTIFISYTDADADVVDVIDTYLSDSGYDVKRYIRDIGNYESIEQFMNGIRKQNFVVPIISDSYLRRINCMYEITQLIKDTDYPDRTFPVIIDLPKSEDRNYSFFDVLYRAEIIKHWEDETKNVKDYVASISPENRGELDFEIRRHSNYSQSIAEFLDWLKSNLVGVVPSGITEDKKKQTALEVAKKIDEKMISKQ